MTPAIHGQTPARRSRLAILGVVLRRLGRIGRSPLLRLAGTGLGLLLLTRRVNLSQAANALGHADPHLALLGVALTGLGMACVVAGWAAVIRASGARIAAPLLASWYLQGIFVGQVTPTGAGGDAVRALGASRAIGAGRGVASLAASRLATGLAMAVIGFAGALLAKVDFGVPVVAGAGVFLLAMLLMWWLALGVHDATRSLAAHRHRSLARVARAVTPVTETLRGLRTRPGALATCVALALAGWMLNIFALQVFAAAVGIHQPPSVFAVAVPISMLTTVAPIAINGIGLREGVLVGLLTHVGVAAARSGALAVLIDLQLVPFALIGGSLLLISRHVRRRAGALPSGPSPAP
jgi:uncharacterized protein (TIRG00374 family)